MFRCGAPGGSSFTVKFASSTSEVGYRVDLDTDWNVYRGSFKGWAANIDCHKICVPADWRTRVECKGLADLGGMMTLDALPMDAPDGIALYAAVWASQGRGYSVKTERGFIAVGGDESFHAETAEKAVAGLLRKCSIGKKSIATIADMSVSVETFIAKYSPIAVNVSLDDARKSGSCEYGIRSWCESVEIDINRGQVSMMELLDGFRKMPLSEVRRAALSAVRRNRSSCPV